MEDEQAIPPYTGESSSLTMEASEQFQVPPPETLPLKGYSQSQVHNTVIDLLLFHHLHMAHHITVAIMLGDKTGVCHHYESVLLALVENPGIEK